MAKKVIKLTEKDLTRLIKRVIAEQPDMGDIFDTITGMGGGTPKDFFKCVEKEIGVKALPIACQRIAIEENTEMWSDCIVALIKESPTAATKVFGCAMTHNIPLPK